jgi:DNA invertase Pin-like site-specific DNA recombinase
VQRSTLGSRPHAKLGLRRPTSNLRGSRRMQSRKGWTLEEDQLYLDEGYSGASLNRPGLDALRDAAAMAEFEAVLITAPDRLARNGRSTRSCSSKSCKAVVVG